MKKNHTLARNVPHTNIYLYNTCGGTKPASVCRYTHAYTMHHCSGIAVRYVYFILLRSYFIIIIIIVLLLLLFFFYLLFYVSSPPYTSAVFRVDPNLLSLCCCPYNIILLYVQNHHAHASESRCCCFVVKRVLEGASGRATAANERACYRLLNVIATVCVHVRAIVQAMPIIVDWPNQKPLTDIFCGTLNSVPYTIYCNAR